jgi:hypothetical protein
VIRHSGVVAPAARTVPFESQLSTPPACAAPYKATISATATAIRRISSATFLTVIRTSPSSFILSSPSQSPCLAAPRFTGVLGSAALRLVSDKVSVFAALAEIYIELACQARLVAREFLHAIRIAFGVRLGIELVRNQDLSPGAIAAIVLAAVPQMFDESCSADSPGSREYCRRRGCARFARRALVVVAHLLVNRPIDVSNHAHAM